MKEKLYIFLLCISQLLFFACANSGKVQTGPASSVENAVKKLEKNPHDDNAIDQLKKSYQLAVDDHQNNIRLFLKDSFILNTTKILTEYQCLQELNILIKNSPVASPIIHPVDFSGPLQFYKEKLANDLFERALTFMGMGDKSSCRQAYKDLKLVLEYKPAYPAAKEKLPEAFHCGSLAVKIYTPPEQFSFYNSEIENFNTRLSKNFAAINSNPFVEILRDNKTSDQPDETVLIQFDKIEIGTVKTDKNTRTADNTSVMQTGTRRTDRVSPPPTPTTVTISRITMSSQIYLTASILNSDGILLNVRQFSSDQEWNSESASFIGDRRLLSPNDQTLLQSSAKNPPSKQQIFTDILNTLEAQILSYLKDHYSHF